MNIFSSLSRWKMTEWCIFLLIYVCIVIQVLVIWQARPIHTAVSTKCHSGDKLILMLYVRCHHYCFLMTSPPSHQLPGQTLVFRLTFFRERKVKNKSFSLTLQNFFLPAFKSTKYLSLSCCKATSFYLFKVKVTTFPTCWQKCDLGWLGWLWPGPSSQMEDVIICEACLEVARARPWLHQQLSTAHNSNNTIQTVAGWEVERRGLLTFNQVQTNKYLDIKYLNIL